MRRVAAISAPPRSANPRGRRALSLLVLSGLSAIIALQCPRVVAASLRSGKGRKKGPKTHRCRAVERGVEDDSNGDSANANGTSTASERRPQRPRSLLDSVHAQSGVQGGAALHRP